MHLNVLVSGLGLMGASLAAALRAAGHGVLLHHRRPEVAAEASRRGWGRALPDLDALRGERCDLAVVGGPVEVIPDQVRAILSRIDTVCTDLGSTKDSICARLVGQPRFIGSHPMCGSHLHGLDNARSDLYQGATVVVCPGRVAAGDAALVEQLWRSVGARTVRLDPALHDALVAQASHLPHVLACLTARHLSAAAVPLAAGGFRDTSRVAAAGPELWTGILRDNRKALLPLVAAAIRDLQELNAALVGDDPALLERWLAAAQAARRNYEQRPEPA